MKLSMALLGSFALSTVACSEGVARMLRRLSPIACLVVTPLLYGCGGAPPPSRGAAPVPLGVTSPTSPRGSAPAPDDPFAWAGEESSNADGKALDARMKAECAWLLKELESAAKRDPKLRGDKDGLARTLQAAAERHGENGKTCLALFEEGMKAYRDASIRTEATATLRMLARDVRASDPTCLASTTAVPRSLDAFAGTEKYASTPADWAEPAWACLGHDGSSFPQRYRYAVHLDAKKSEFVAVAERGDGQETLFVRGPVQGGTPDVVQKKKK